MTNRCSITGCDGVYEARGFCRIHYRRFRKYGDPNVGAAEPADRDERFRARYEVADRGCWEWLGVLNAAGYGRFRTSDGRKVAAHRYSYELHVGLIPNDLTLDHLCRNRRCVNPAHLEIVTRGENTLRSDGVTARNAVATHCPNGHPYDTANTYHRPDGNRGCRICIRERGQRWQERQRLPRAGELSGINQGETR